MLNLRMRASGTPNLTLPIELTRDSAPGSPRGGPDKLDIIDGRVVGARPGPADRSVREERSVGGATRSPGEAFTKIPTEFEMDKLQPIWERSMPRSLSEPGYRPLASNGCAAAAGREGGGGRGDNRRRVELEEPQSP